MNGTEYSGFMSSIQIKFTSVGSYQINITAKNRISQRTLVGYVEAVDKLMGMVFHAGAFNASTSTIGSDAKFWFMLKTGMAYECAIDYGDGTTDTFNDYVN